MSGALIGVALLVGALAVGVDPAAAEDEPAPSVLEHVVGVSREGDGRLAIVVVHCDGADRFVAGEQLGVWSRRPGPRQVRWAIQAGPEGAELPEAVVYGVTPPGFQTLQPPRDLRADAGHLLVADGTVVEVSGEPFVFQPSEMVADRIWDGTAFTALDGLRRQCTLPSNGEGTGASEEDFNESMLGYVLLIYFLGFAFLALLGLGILLIPIVVVVRARRPQTAPASLAPGPSPRWPPPEPDPSASLPSTARNLPPLGPAPSIGPLPPPPLPPPPSPFPSPLGHGPGQPAVGQDGLPPPPPVWGPRLSNRQAALFVLLNLLVLVPVLSMLWRPVAKGVPTLTVWVMTLVGWQLLLLWLHHVVGRSAGQRDADPLVVAVGVVAALPMAFTMARVLPDTAMAPLAFMASAGLLAAFWFWLRRPQGR